LRHALREGGLLRRRGGGSHALAGWRSRGALLRQNHPDPPPNAVRCVTIADPKFRQASMETRMIKRKKALTLAALGLALGLGACTDPNDPGQRAVGGGLIGGAAGAGIGALAGGGQGALIGGLAGTALGAGTGYITTPTPNAGY
jgi:hypothetical protein